MQCAYALGQLVETFGTSLYDAKHFRIVAKLPSKDVYRAKPWNDVHTCSQSLLHQ